MTPTYDDRIVAFIDILGFSELIKITTNQSEPEKAIQTLEEIYSVVSYIKNHIAKSRDKGFLHKTTSVTLFSDTIVISQPKAESAGIFAVFRLLKKLQIQLLKRNILLRGSVVYGKLIHEENIILGPALVNAYNVETKSAVYPRIVIDPKVTYLYQRTGGITIGKKRIRDGVQDLVFTNDFDGTYYIDYFTDTYKYLGDGNVERYREHMRKLIKKGLENKDTGIRMKYLWMREKLKDAIEFEMEMEAEMIRK